MNDSEAQARVREALDRTDVMALSTIDEDGGPWTSPVQYQWDSQLNLYFACQTPGTPATFSVMPASQLPSTTRPARQAATSACRSAAPPR
jgi:hypothetical protein